MKTATPDQVEVLTHLVNTCKDSLDKAKRYNPETGYVCAMPNHLLHVDKDERGEYFINSGPEPTVYNLCEATILSASMTNGHGDRPTPVPVAEFMASYIDDAAQRLHEFKALALSHGVIIG